MKFLSHIEPDKLLVTHLNEVKEYACENARILKYEVELVSLLHDIGKYTTFFQTHLRTKSEVQNSKHGFISAIICAYIALNKYTDNTPLLLYSVILSHHGDIKPWNNKILPTNIRSMIDNDIELDSKIKMATIQIDDMKKNKEDIIEDYQNTSLKYDIRYVLDNFNRREMENTLLKLKRMLSKMEEDKNEFDYLKHQYIYSLLIWADKISASRLVPVISKYCSKESLEEQKNIVVKNTKSNVNDIRNKIYTHVMNAIECNVGHNIYTITAPTGTGKTYTGFLSAVKLREQAELNGKIIYALPFTSIIEQNYIDIKKLYDNLNCKETSYVMMHHHLSDLKYDGKDSELENYNISQIQELYEGWSSGVIVTTFVQLMQTLIGNRNKMLKKFHDFYESIILIDEIQAMDIRYYRLVEKVFGAVTKYLKCKIIIMTATKPNLCNTAIELLDNGEIYFNELQRVKIKYQPEPISIDTFTNIFNEKYNPEKSYMIVCNTVRQSLDVFQQIKELGICENIFYLSANLIPSDKKRVIEEVKKVQKERKKEHVLVTTQVVEAGVNLDFDFVYRDMAPLSSIIQTAGRCNRGDRGIVGEVFVLNMVDNGKDYSTMVYERNQISQTKKVLEDFTTDGEILEKDFYKMITCYYERMNEIINKDTSNEMIEAIEKLDFEKISEFTLIKENLNYVNVFCITDSEAQKTFDEYIKCLSIRDKIVRKEKLLEIRSSINNYTVYVPKKVAQKCSMKEEINLYYVEKDRCTREIDKDCLYSSITGFNRQEIDVDLIW